MELENAADTKRSSGMFGLSGKESHIYSLFCVISFLVNFDDGLIPAVLPLIQQDLELDYVTQGSLSSFLHLGMVLSTFIAGGVLSMFSVRSTLSASCISTGGCVILFALAPNAFCLLAARLACGMVAAFYVVQAPVWIDDFIPVHMRAKLISTWQVTGPLGIVMGYATGMITSKIAGTHTGFWRLPFMLQSVLIFLVGISFVFCDEKDLDGRAGYTSIDGSEESQASQQKISLWGSLKSYWFVLTHPLFLTIVMGLTTLYYVVSGIMFWVTSYMVDRFHGEILTIGMLYLFDGSTAPVLGALFGGGIIDWMGGYKGRRQLKKTINFMIISATISMIACLAAGFITNMYLFAFCLWCILFFGGCVVSPGSGCIMTVCGNEYKHITSAVSQGFFNFGGYFLAPLLTGVVMETSNITWGFRSIMFVSIIGWVSITISHFLIDRYYQVATPAFPPRAGNLDETAELIDIAPVGTPPRDGLQKRKRTYAKGSPSFSSLANSKVGFPLSSPFRPIKNDKVL